MLWSSDIGEMFTDSCHFCPTHSVHWQYPIYCLVTKENDLAGRQILCSETRTSLKKFIHYFHTIRHLRIHQVPNRLFRKLRGQASSRAVPASIALRSLTIPTPWLKKQPQRDGGFIFLNLRKNFPHNTIDWRCVEMPKLWRYNLHYFDHLLDAHRFLEDRRNLIDDWIAKNPEGTLDAWEPYPASLRVVNWIKLFVEEGSGRVKPEWLKSLYQQALWLEHNIEYHLLANHLFKNAKALVFAGLFSKEQMPVAGSQKGSSCLMNKSRNKFYQMADISSAVPCIMP